MYKLVFRLFDNFSVPKLLAESGTSLTNDQYETLLNTFLRSSRKLANK